MRTNAAFWDSSALIPLCQSQVFTSHAAKVKRQYGSIVIWWGTTVEIHSGLARLKRESLLNERQSARALRWWNQLQAGAHAVTPDHKVIDLAVGLPGLYSLRAMDAFQLAAALIWCSERPRKRPFVTADNRLGEAASDAGFDVVVLI